MPARHPIPVSQVEMVYVCERRGVVPITRSYGEEGVLQLQGSEELW